MRRHFLTYLSLSTVAIAQPILDLYGNNTTVFSAAKLSRLEVSLFLAVVVFVPAVLALCLDRVSMGFGSKVNEATRLVIISGFSFLFGFATARWAHLDSNLAAFALAILFAIAIPYAYDNYKSIREWSRWLSVVSVAVLGGALLQLQPILLETQGAASDAIIGNQDITVLQIVLDEFPLYSLLGSDGRINAERFPGFAALAESATWYRNSVAVSNFTHQAVPAILTSSFPVADGGPFLAQYPKNIFTLFGGKTTVGGIEPVTSLCPRKVCGTESAANGIFDARRFGYFIRDAGYVYGQRVLPRLMRKYVPSIEGTWGGFGAVADKFKDSFDVGALTQVDAIARGVQDLVADPNPRVQVIHALVPHAPWRLTADGRVAPLSPSIGTSNPESEDGVRDTYQTFLHQLGAADAEIMSVIDVLKKNNRWDTTLLVVTADHGISFLPTLPQRHTDFIDAEQADDIFRIPTFIKYPEQTSGSISDCAISNLDLLPTIVAVMETSTEWKFDGLSLSKSCPVDRTRRVVSATGEESVLSTGFESSLGRSEYYDSLVSNIGPMQQVSAVGNSASLIGRKISAASPDVLATSWTLKQKNMFNNVQTTRGSKVPSLITGVVSLKDSVDEGVEGIIAIDGIAAGVIAELSGSMGEVPYTAVLDYSLLTKGDHVVELFIRNSDGVISKVGAPS